MGFLGELTTLGGEAVRPHDVGVSLEPIGAGAVAGTVRRVLRIGFEARLSVLTADGQDVTVVLTRASARALGLAPGDRVWLAKSVGAVSVGVRAGEGTYAVAQVRARGLVR